MSNVQGNAERGIYHRLSKYGEVSGGWGINKNDECAGRTEDGIPWMRIVMKIRACDRNLLVLFHSLFYSHFFRIHNKKCYAGFKNFEYLLVSVLLSISTV